MKSSDDGLTEVLTIRFTTSEKQEIQARADADQRKIADWIRLAVRRILLMEKRVKR